MTTQTSALQRTIASVRRVWADLDRASQAMFEYRR
jgi:hypothetical protein